jgi:ribonuclease T1
MKSRAFILTLVYLLAVAVSNTGLGYAIGAPAGPSSLQGLDTDPATAQEPSSSSSRDGISGTTQLPSSPRSQEIPAKAHAILRAILDRDGNPPPGYVGGRTFQNREQRLPRGKYREYDIEPKRPGKSRGAERIVIERRTGEAYYTGDHYRTFVPMN